MPVLFLYTLVPHLFVGECEKIDVKRCEKNVLKKLFFFYLEKCKMCLTLNVKRTILIM